MTTHIIPVREILSPAEYMDIDLHCASGRRMNSLKDISDYLMGAFSITVELDQDIVDGYSSDQSNLPGKASALCRPRDEKECAAILRACYCAQIPVTISAGRTNLTGSATPESGLVLSVSRMTSPAPRVDIPNRSVICPVGIHLEKMRRTVYEMSSGRLYFPVDPTSRNDAMVGGSVSCNASGFTPGEKGAMRPWVRSLQVLLMNGKGISCTRNQYVSRNGEFVLSSASEMTTVPVPTYNRPSIKNASGPFSSPDGAVDFVDLMTGSEGIFALATECSLGLAEYPGPFLDLFLSLPKEKDALELLRFLAVKHPFELKSLTAIEYFGPFCRRYMNHDRRLFKDDNEVALYLQIPCHGLSFEHCAGDWLRILTASGSSVHREAVMALISERDQSSFFEARHSLPANSIEEAKRRGAHTIMTDTVIPPSRFEEFLGYTHELIVNAGLDYLVFGHMGDCHLHFMILPRKDQLLTAQKAYDSIIDKSASLGGVYSGEHGTGKRKREDFLKCYGPDAARQTLATKRAFDPFLLLNRDNVITCP